MVKRKNLEESPPKSVVSNHHRKTEFRMSFVWLNPQNFDSRMGSRNGFSFPSSFQDDTLHLGLKNLGWGKEEQRDR